VRCLVPLFAAVHTGIVMASSEEFEAAFRELLPRAYWVAFRVLGNRAEAEEAAAEALARAHASWGRVGGLPWRDAWVLRVTANVAVDICRRRQRPMPARSLAATDEGEVVALRLALSAALATLPRRQREVIALRYLADLTESEVAACLHVSLGSVKRHGYRGMAALRQLLDVPDDGAGLRWT
jgi:RNA polymerase sigma-70 factor (ECF subfamily)